MGSTAVAPSFSAVLVSVAVGARVLGADVVTGDLGEGLRLVQAGARDEVLHVAEVGGRVQVGVRGLRGRETLQTKIVPVQRAET